VTNFRALVETLATGRVDFVLIGGLALVLRGSSRVTEDFDLCYSRERANLERLVTALAPFRPRLRGVPEDLPFLWDAQTLRSGMNFTLTTTIGDVDLLGEVAGVGAFSEVDRDATPLDLYGHSIRVMSLDALERAKRAAGRAKDLLDLGEIASIRSRTKG
jgi:hypothetical protein